MASDLPRTKGAVLLKLMLKIRSLGTTSRAAMLMAVLRSEQLLPVRHRRPFKSKANHASKQCNSNVVLPAQSLHGYRALIPRTFERPSRLLHILR
jgi:hypothetical protein